MSQDQNIDKLFAKKLSGRSFKTDMNAWMKMRKILESSDLDASWQRWKLWFIIAGIPLVSMIPGLINFDVKDTNPVAEIKNPDKNLLFSNEKKSEEKNTYFSNGNNKVKTNATDEEGFLEDMKSINEKLVKKNNTKRYTDIQKGIIQTDETAVLKNVSVAGKEDFKDVDTVNLDNESLIEMKALELSQIQSTDSSAPVLSKNPIKERINILKRFSTGLLFGTNLSSGFLNNGIHRANISARPFAGIQFEIVLNEVMAIGMNAIFQTRGGLNSTLITTDLSELQSLDQWTTSTYSVRELYYLELPVYFDYRSERSNFTLGMQFAYLAAARSEFTDLLQNSQGIISTQSGNSWTEKDSFSSHDIAVMIGYNYMLNERFDICGRMSYGLYDVTDDQVFNTGSVIDRNLQMKIYLTYHLLHY